MWLTRIGASAVLLGAAYFFKYAVDNDWIGPWPRVALGTMAGIGAIVVAERSRAKTHRAWADLVTALGMGLLLFSAYASYAYYSLVPLGAAFTAFFVVSCLGGALSVVHESETILVFSLTAACSAPVLLSTGKDNPAALFGYLFVVTALSHAAALHRRFLLALWLGAIGPAVLFVGWYDRFFDVHEAYASLASRAAPLGAVALFLGMWLVVHDRVRRLPTRSTTLVARYAAATATPAFASLLYDRPVVAASVMVALGLLFAAFSKRDESPALLLISLVASAASLLLLPEETKLNLGLIGVVGAWAAAYFGAATRELLAGPSEEQKQAELARAEHLLVSAGSGLALIGVAFEHGAGDHERLAAALFALVGVADLGLGAALLKKGRSSGFAAAPLGLALGLFAASIAFLFAGPVVTIAWAALAATVVWLAAERKDGLWLAGGLALFAATIVRLIDVDWASPDLLREEFVSSLGARGRIEPALLFNERAYALLAAGLALLTAGRTAARALGRRIFSVAAGALVTCGHLVLLALCIVEARHAATPRIDLPSGGLETDDIYSILQLHEQHVLEVTNRLSMVTTLVMGVYAALLISVGFGVREPGHRYLGLGLFAVTLAKLIGFDVWQLERVHQILILVGVGALLLGASFLYARFGGRLLKILGGGSSAAMVVVGLALPRTALAAIDPPAFSHVTEITGVAAPGLYRFDVVAPLYRKSRSEQHLADVRIAGPHGEETPYFYRPLEEPDTGHHAASMLDPVSFPDGRVRATFDLGVTPVRHGSAHLGIDGEDFLRGTLIEVSDDGKEFGQIQEGRVVYRASHGAKAAEDLDVRYPASTARYVRVTLLAGDGNVVGFTGAEFSGPKTASRFLQRFELTVLRTDRNKEEKTTTVSLDAEEPGVPIEKIRLEIEWEGGFERRVEVTGANDMVHWFPVGSGFIYRLPTPSGGKNESIEIDVGRSRKRYFAFKIYDGDDTPLGTRSGIAMYSPEEIVFRASAAGPHHLFVGAPMLARPSYDLASVVVRGVGEPPKEAALAPLAENPDYVAPEGTRTLSQRYGTLFAVGFGIVVVGLALFTFRLLKMVPKS